MNARSLGSLSPLECSRPVLRTEARCARTGAGRVVSRVFQSLLAVVMLSVVACGGAPPRARGGSARAPLPESYAAAASAGDELGYTRLAASELGAVDGMGARAEGALVVLVRTARGDSQVSLARAYAACARAPRACDATTRDYLASVATALMRGAEESGAAPERLRLAVRPADVIAAYRERMGGIVSRPLVADLHALVMVDFPESARPLLASELASLGLDEAGAIERARANVVQENGPWPAEIDGLAPGNAVGLAAGRYYESSRLLDAAGLAELERRAGGPVLVVAPTNDTLLLASAGDPMAPIMLAQIAAEVAERGRPLSTTVLRVSGGVLEVVR